MYLLLLIYVKLVEPYKISSNSLVTFFFLLLLKRENLSVKNLIWFIKDILIDLKPEIDTTDIKTCKDGKFVRYIFKVCHN